MHGLCAARALPSPQASFRAAPSPSRRAPRRPSAMRPGAQGDDGAEPPASGLLTPQFMGVLQQSLARQGGDALTKGVQVSDEARTSAVEEVLTTALNQSKQTLRMLQQWRHQIDAQIAAQEKQVDRMEFALHKARSDAAMLATLKTMAYGDSD